MAKKSKSPLEEMQERTREETSRVMDDATFNELFNAGDYDLILMDGGADLTPSQMAKMKAKGKQDSEEKLQKMAYGLASSPGYREMMLLPIMSKMMPQVFSKNDSRGNMDQKDTNAQSSEIKSQKENSPEQASVKEDTKHTTIGPGTNQDLRVNDSESNILGKMFNFMKQDYEFRSNMEKDKEKYRKEKSDRKDAEINELIGVLTGKKASKTKKVGIVSKKTGLLKYGALGAAGLGALMLSKGALANIDWKSMLPSFESLKEPGVTKDLAPLVMEQSDDVDAAKKAAESYLGKKISNKEWDVLLRTTAAESAQDTTSQAMVMATILNRARTRFGGEEESIIKAVEQPYQFQAVTGTRFNANQPSQKYVSGPSKSETKSIIAGAINILPKVSKEQEYFTATTKEAYGPGTNIGFLHEMRKAGGYERAGTIFNKPPPDMTGEIPKSSVEVLQNGKVDVIPQKIKPESKKTSSVGIINNNTNIISGATNYNVAGSAENNNNASLVDKQYFSYG